jgi:hypothetical protein
MCRSTSQSAWLHTSLKNHAYQLTPDFVGLHTFFFLPVMWLFFMNQWAPIFCQILRRFPDFRNRFCSIVCARYFQFAACACLNKFTILQNKSLSILVICITVHQNRGLQFCARCFHKSGLKSLYNSYWIWVVSTRSPCNVRTEWFRTAYLFALSGFAPSGFAPIEYILPCFIIFSY